MSLSKNSSKAFPVFTRTGGLLVDDFSKQIFDFQQGDDCRDGEILRNYWRPRDGGDVFFLSFFFFLKHLFKVGMLNETLVNLSEDEREMMAGWGLDVKRKEGWRDCSCVEATNTPKSARWLEQENLKAEPVSEAMPGWCEVSG